MDGLIQAGQRLRMVQGGAMVTVERRLGEGGQGVVHQARVGAAPFAVKWIRPGPGSAELRESISGLIRGGRPPHRAFIWPIDLVSSDTVPGFGYLMPLLDPRFGSLAPILNLEHRPSFRALITIGRELVDAFAALHSSGRCYRDISFGNLRVDLAACEVAVIDIDNVGVDGAFTLVKGTGPFMAPEILRDEALPSTITDLHSLAVMLFYLLMHGHPLLGIRADAAYSWEEARHISETELLVSNFGLHPLFVFDPEDRSNAPVPGTSITAWWPIYPLPLRRVFTQAFTKGLHDATLDGRVLEGTWRRALLAAHDCVSACPACQAAVYYDREQPAQRCWHCRQIVPAPPALTVPGGTLVLSDGAVVSRHHLYRDHQYRTACASVEPYPGRPGRVVLRNLTDTAWIVRADGEEPKRVVPGQRLGVRPMQIDFGQVQGSIR